MQRAGTIHSAAAPKSLVPRRPSDAVHFVSCWKSDSVAAPRVPAGALAVLLVSLRHRNESRSVELHYGVSIA
jgi:hypothetical protein